MISGQSKHTKLIILAIKVFIIYSQYCCVLHTHTPVLLCVIGFNSALMGSVVSDTLTSVSRSPRVIKGAHLSASCSLFSCCCWATVFRVSEKPFIRPLKTYRSVISWYEGGLLWVWLSCLLGKNHVRNGTVAIQASKEAEHFHLRLLRYCWLISFPPAFSDFHPCLKLPGVWQSLCLMHIALSVFILNLLVSTVCSA